jgi:hypothetical protein
MPKLETPLSKFVMGICLPFKEGQEEVRSLAQRSDERKYAPHLYKLRPRQILSQNGTGTTIKYGGPDLAQLVDRHLLHRAEPPHHT